MAKRPPPGSTAIDVDALDRWSRSAATLPATLLRELIDTAPTLGASDVPLMPAPRRDALLAAVLPAMRAMPAFERAPEWDGAPAETGALARTHAHPLVAALRARWGNSVPTRMVARLVELALLLRALSGARTHGEATRWVEAFAPNRARAWRRWKPRAACSCIARASTAAASRATRSSRRPSGIFIATAR